MQDSSTAENELVSLNTLDDPTIASGKAVARSADPQVALDEAIAWARYDGPTIGWRRVLHRVTGINLGPSRREAQIRNMLAVIVDELPATATAPQENDR